MQTTEETAPDPDTHVGVRLRQLRLGRRLTLREVARGAGITEGFLSQVETGRSAPSLRTLRTISAALGMDPSDVLDSGSSTLPTMIHRSGGRTLSIGDVSKFRVTPSNMTHLEIIRGELVPGGSTGEGYVPGDSDEALVVVSGIVEAVVDGQAHTLSAGDTLCYRSSMAHSTRNTGDVPATVLWIVSPPTNAGRSSFS